MRFWRFVSIVLRKPRVVLDTNVLISASIAEQGYSAAILQSARQRRILLVISPYIIQEYTGVMHRPHIIRKYQGIEGRVGALAHYLNVHTILVEPQTIERIVPQDSISARFRSPNSSSE
jgi:putative PIN family toxin of toxin-antitoxin system